MKKTNSMMTPIILIFTFGLLLLAIALWQKTPDLFQHITHIFCAY